MKSPYPKVQGWATFSLAELLESRAGIGPRCRQATHRVQERLGEATFKQLTSRTLEDLFDESEALRPSRQDLRLSRDTRTGKPLGTVAEGRTGFGTSRSVGPSPGDRGRGRHGKPLKLSDHRGKVIILTFSGIWCPSCHVLYPQQRELLKRHQGRPFAVLSVDTDEDKAPLRKDSTRARSPGPAGRDGGVGGSLAGGPRDLLLSHGLRDRPQRHRPVQGHSGAATRRGGRGAPEGGNLTVLASIGLKQKPVPAIRNRQDRRGSPSARPGRRPAPSKALSRDRGLCPFQMMRENPETCPIFDFS